MFRRAALACVVASLCVLCACSGCAHAPAPTALLPGDSGPCTTAVLQQDGGISYVPCSFGKASP